VRGGYVAFYCQHLLEIHNVNAKLRCRVEDVSVIVARPFAAREVTYPEGLPCGECPAVLMSMVPTESHPSHCTHLPAIVAESGRKARVCSE